MSDEIVRNEISIRIAILHEACRLIESIVCKQLITRIEVEKQLLVLIHDAVVDDDPDDPSIKVIVKTEYDIISTDLIQVLILCGVFPFEHERWLHSQLNQYEEKLVIDLDGGVVTVDDSHSR